MYTARKMAAVSCCPIFKPTFPFSMDTPCDHSHPLGKLKVCCVTIARSAIQKPNALTASSERLAEATPWNESDSDITYMARCGRLVQWYPGHIAKAEKELKEKIKVIDVILEVRDARIPIATCHPEIDAWIGDKKKIIVLNRADMISNSDKNAWANYFAFQGNAALFTDGKHGAGTMKLGRMVRSVAKVTNEKRKAKGLLPRAVRAVVVGYPNVGKSSLINRLLKRKKCEAAPRPGVTRELKWARIGEDLELLDAPGILPMRILDQAGATRLAICNDIGESAYAVAGVAAFFVELLKRLPNAGPQVLQNRYKIDAESMSGEVFLEELGQKLFAGDINKASHRVLQDFRKGELGWLGLERPPSVH